MQVFCHSHDIVDYIHIRLRILQLWVMSCHPEPKLPQVTTTKLHLHWPV